MSFLFAFVSLAFALEPAAAWTTREVPLHRWVDADLTIATVDPGSRVEVLTTDGQQTRIRRGIDFGWIPSDALTQEAPAGAIDLGGFGFGSNITVMPSVPKPAPQ
jgi:hypothetical protein